MTKKLAKALFGWYSKRARDLPWRGQKDPYTIWVSEVMLQQTQVETVIPYYLRWMEAFPNVEALAEAGIDEVLILWEGLGYYRRAHNLHKAAQIITSELGGVFPLEYEEIKNLPGVGPYIAAAIAAFAYEADVIALDGNLRRVLSRIFNFEGDPRSKEGEESLVSRALLLMPSGTSSKFNQAIMDLGSLICLPREPMCSKCPIGPYCEAYAKGVQKDRPIRKKKEPIPHFTVTAGVLERDGKILIARRPEGELLGGLWEFPGGKCEEDEILTECLQREWREELGLDIDGGEQLGIFPHAYTHFRVIVHAFRCSIKEGEPIAHEHLELRWVKPEEFEKYPMGKVDREISRVIVRKML